MIAKARLKSETEILFIDVRPEYVARVGKIEDQILVDGDALWVVQKNRNGLTRWDALNWKESEFVQLPSQPTTGVLRFGEEDAQLLAVGTRDGTAYIVPSGAKIGSEMRPYRGTGGSLSPITSLFSSASGAYCLHESDETMPGNSLVAVELGELRGGLKTRPLDVPTNETVRVAPFSIASQTFVATSSGRLITVKPTQLGSGAGP